MTTAEILPAIKTKAEADAIVHRLLMSGGVQDEAIIRSNIGYVAGYFNCQPLVPGSG